MQILHGAVIQLGAPEEGVEVRGPVLCAAAVLECEEVLPGAAPTTVQLAQLAPRDALM